MNFAIKLVIPDNVIKPTLLVHQLLLSEREREFLLWQLDCMIPYFFITPLRPLYHLAPFQDTPPAAIRGQDDPFPQNG